MSRKVVKKERKTGPRRPLVLVCNALRRNIRGRFNVLPLADRPAALKKAGLTAISGIDGINEVDKLRQIHESLF